MGICDANNISMTVYVDDTIFSSEKEISLKVRFKIIKIVEKHGYKASMKKVKYYSANEVKKITGVVIRANGSIEIPNKLRYKIKKRFEVHKKSGSVDDLNKLAGCVVAARQINKQVYPSVLEYIKKERNKERINR